MSGFSLVSFVLQIWVQLALLLVMEAITAISERLHTTNFRWDFKSYFQDHKNDPELFRKSDMLHTAFSLMALLG